MIYDQLLLDVHDELIVDLFAGGGGASSGIEMATGRQVDVAINHDAAAVALHQANHPQTKHHVSDVFEVDPHAVTDGRPIGFLWASPDCTDHSKAKGGKPIRNKKRRALAWVVKRWAGQVQPRVICLENVEEFIQWGPLVGLPGALRRCDKRKGKTFRRFVRDLEELGYQVEHRELRACDYGAPTIRKRLFLIARCDGEPIVWPEPTHGPAGSGLKSFRTAADCIDWSIPMCSIFATKDEAKDWGKEHGKHSPKRPLAEKTMARIARGVRKYVVEAARPFIVTMAHGETSPSGAKRWGRGARGLDEPHPTVAASSVGTGLVAPFMVPRYGERPGQEPRTRSIEEPAPVVVPTGNGGNLVAAHLSTYYGEKRPGEHRGTEMEEPLHTQTTENRHAVVATHIQRDFGMSVGQESDAPLGTVTPGGQGKSALVASFLAQNNEGFYAGAGRSLDEPNGTVLASGSHHSLVAAHLSHQYTSNTNGGQGDPEQPLKTQTTANHAGLVYGFLQKYHGMGTGTPLDGPASTVTTKDRMGLVTVMLDGVLHVIVDIAMRMLQPRELYRAQGFHDGYVIDRGADGRKLTKTEQVRMVGNSVCPPVAAALVAANVPEMIARDEAREAVA